MYDTLRLVIDEPAAGKFFWSLVKPMHSNEKPMVVDFAMGPLSSAKAAQSAGDAALRRSNTAGCEPAVTWGGHFAETLPAEL